MQLKLNALQQEYDCDKKNNAQLLELYSNKCTNAEQELIKAHQTILELETKLVTLKEDQEVHLKKLQGMLKYQIFCVQYLKMTYLFCLESWNTKFDNSILKAREEIEVEKSNYQKLLSEKRSIEEKLELYERQTMNGIGDNFKRNASDLSLLSYQENGYTTNDASVSYKFQKYSLDNFFFIVYAKFHLAFMFITYYIISFYIFG